MTRDFDRDVDSDARKAIPRREFLRKTAAAGVVAGAMVYAKPFIKTSYALPPIDWREMGPINDAVAAADFAPVHEQPLNILLYPQHAEKWKQPAGAAAMTDEEVNAFFDEGWLLSSGVTQESDLHDAVNGLFSRPVGDPWPMTDTNQSEYVPPPAFDAREELTLFEAEGDMDEATPAAAAVIGAALVCMMASEAP